MKQILKLFILMWISTVFTSCYEDYIDDYDYSSIGFAVKQPLRTVIADRDMEIRVGVSIGGKRAVDMNDWATFIVYPDTVPSGKLLLPESYYKLSDPQTMKVHKSNLPVADVGITFTDDFYADPESLTGKYVLPFLITDSSLDSVFNSLSVAAIKYISTFHGTYYVKGKLYELDTPGGNVVNTTVYDDKDLVKNITRDISTVDRYTVVRPGLANFNIVASEKVQMKFTPSDNKTWTMEVSSPAGSTAITNASGMYDGNKANPEIVLYYSFAKGGKNYKVEETLILRQDPLFDLRVESWQ